LPGYGYARRGKENVSVCAQSSKIIILSVANDNLFVLVDSRLDRKIDFEFMEWLGENAIRLP
jgi:GTP-binding protein EngB required for normal cell division